MDMEKNNINFKNPDFLIDKISAALYLRYIIEIVVSIFVSNNKKNLKDKEKLNTGKTNKVIDILYENKDIDAGIFKGEITETSINLYIHWFWTKEKLKENYDFLSKQIHRFHELNEDCVSSEYSSCLNLVDNYYEANNKIFNKLKEIGIILYNTLYNHLISVENDEAIIEVKNMEIFTFYPDDILKFNKK